VPDAVLTVQSEGVAVIQSVEGLSPVHNVSERRSGSLLYGLLLGLHGLPLTHAVFDSDMHPNSVSHVKERITKLFSRVCTRVLLSF